MKATDFVEVNPKKMSGTPVFRGTRVPIRNLFDCLEDDETLEQFLEEFSTVTREQVAGILELSKQRLPDVEAGMGDASPLNAVSQVGERLGFKEVSREWGYTQMISERSFASSFEGFWSELLPLLTPAYVHMISEMYKEPLTDFFGIPLKPIPKAADTASAVMAEFAFYLVKNAIQNDVNVRTAFGDEGLRSNAEMTAADAVRRYEGTFQYPSIKLKNDELSEGFMIAENYERFFEQMSSVDRPEFEPIVAGAGFLQTCRADVSIGQALFEVKTVDRNLASKDIRQLIVYLALQAATGERRWTVGGFFNPRKAEYHEFAVDEVIAQISGGRSSSEVYHALIDFACSWDIQFDTAF